MPRILLAIWLVVMTYVIANYTDVTDIKKKINFTNAVRIYQKIIIANNIMDAPKLYRDTDMSVNAMTDESDVGGIYLNDGIMLNYIHNDDELAMVLAHELGHWAHRGREVQYQQEYDADKFGAKAMDIAGYNHCRGAMVLWRFGHHDSWSHPPGDYRWLAVTQGCYGEADK